MGWVCTNQCTGAVARPGLARPLGVKPSTHWDAHLGSASKPSVSSTKPHWDLTGGQVRGSGLSQPPQLGDLSSQP